jgi:inorganic pyrophosphatase
LEEKGKELTYRYLPPGIVYVQDETGTEDKAISVARHVPTHSPIYKVMKSLKHLLVETEHFSTGHKKVERNHVTSFDWHGPTEAGHGIERAPDPLPEVLTLAKGRGTGSCKPERANNW